MTTISAPATFVGPSPAEQAAVWALPQRLVAAWAEQDAEAFSRLFAEDGSMILPGLYKQGREEIRKYMAEAFATKYKGTRVTGQPVNIKFINDQTVVLITVGGVLRPGEKKLSDLNSIRATWLCAKQPDGQWQLACYQNCPSQLPT
jgi:uncharacterized protein (TIGR02246 family)